MNLTHLLHEVQTVPGVLIFLVSYFVFAWGKFPGTRIDRPAMAVIGAALLFVFRVPTPSAALESIDFNTLVLLFSMMVIVAALHLAGFFEWITAHVIERIPHQHLVGIVIVTGGVLSAFLVNDVICVFMTPLLLHITSKLKRSATPYLLALATASNIGSAATITGNPQNMLIGSVSQIGYTDFLLHLGPIALVGRGINWLVLRLMCAKDLACELEEQPAFTPMPRPVPRPLGADAARAVPAPDGAIWKPVVITVFVLSGFLLGLPPALVAISGVILLLMSRQISPRALYEEVDWSLLLFFAGLFLILGGAQSVHITDDLLAAARHLNLENTAIFAAVVSLLSNLVSNVPAVMLLRPVMGQFRNPHSAWLLLSMASTLAGNLTITGSVANIYSTITSKPGSASDECQKVRIDHVGMGGHHAVGEARVNLQRAMLQQLSLQQ
jgi:Na+/H+ antiporter NhaD/arsenite permease-like protein